MAIHILCICQRKIDKMKHIFFFIILSLTLIKVFIANIGKINIQNKIEENE